MRNFPISSAFARHILRVLIGLFTVVAYYVVSPSLASAATVTTTIEISICGNGVIDSNEVCDDGLFNDGGYGSTTAQRRCLPNCKGYGPYCGDSILMPIYSEQCDDGNNTDGDFCSSICQIEATTTGSTPPSGGGSGAGGVSSGLIPILQQTRVVIQGKAYPNAVVNVLKDGQVLGIATADRNASFSFETGAITPGATTFGFWATDAKGLRSITFTTTFQVTQNAVSTVSNVYLPPTIDLRQKKIDFGSMLDVFGSTAPNSKVSVYLDKETTPRAMATSTEGGDWTAAVLAENLENEAFHNIKAMFQSLDPGTPVKSGFSQLVNFYVGQRDVKVPGSSDLNGDGRVNLTDFSILLFNWGKSGGVADLNQDGMVNLTDLSIMLFAWTG
jgi:cysteine-rich repeat protein